MNEELENISLDVVNALKHVVGLAVQDPEQLVALKRPKSILKTQWFAVINALFDLSDLVKAKVVNTDFLDEAEYDQVMHSWTVQIRELETRKKILTDELDLVSGLKIKSRRLQGSKQEKLKIEIARLHSSFDTVHSKLLMTAEESEMKEKERHNLDSNRIQHDLMRETKLLNETSEKNKEWVQIMKRKINSINEALEKIMEEYDVKFKEKSNLLTLTSEEFLKEKTLLEEKKRMIAVLAKERFEASRESLETDTKIMKAVRLIQRCWKGFSARKMLRAQQVAKALAEKASLAGEKGIDSTKNTPRLTSSKSMVAKMKRPGSLIVNVAIGR